jgi:hypothetical protein
VTVGRVAVWCVLLVVGAALDGVAEGPLPLEPPELVPVPFEPLELPAPDEVAGLAAPAVPGVPIHTQLTYTWPVPASLCPEGSTWSCQRSGWDQTWLLLVPISCPST